MSSVKYTGPMLKKTYYVDCKKMKISVGTYTCQTYGLYFIIMSANSELTTTLDHSYLVLLYLFDFDTQIGTVDMLTFVDMSNERPETKKSPSQGVDSSKL